jgi:hypothetical protein
MNTDRKTGDRQPFFANGAKNGGCPLNADKKEFGDRRIKKDLGLE